MSRWCSAPWCWPRAWSRANWACRGGWANLGLLELFLAVKVGFKFVGVYPLARRYMREHATYTTLLMSTGLTFGTISATYGLGAGIIDPAQFSVLVTVVVLTAVVPTAIAQRFFSPDHPTAHLDPATPGR